MRNNLYFMGDKYYDLSQFNGKNNYKNILRGNIPKECMHSFFSEFKEVTNENFNHIFQFYDDILKDNEIVVIEHITKELELFKKYDALSDIAMFDFFQNNYKKEKLFINYDHPSIGYFRELFIRILNYIKLKNNTFCFDIDNIPHFKKHEHPLYEFEVPVLKYVKQYGNFEFDDSNEIGMFNNFFCNYKNFIKIYLFALFNDNFKEKYITYNDDNYIFNKIVNDIIE